MTDQILTFEYHDKNLNIFNYKNFTYEIGQRAKLTGINRIMKESRLE